MLQKCANPSCSAPFRSLREGKLFLAENLPRDPNSSSPSPSPKLRRREYFWLCQACSTQLTLRLDTDRGMTTVPIAQCVAPGFLTRAV